MRPSLIIEYPKQKVSSLIELDFRTEESDVKNRINGPYNETRIYRLVFEESPREK